MARPRAAAMRSTSPAGRSVAHSVAVDTASPPGCGRLSSSRRNSFGALPAEPRGSANELWLSVALINSLHLAFHISESPLHFTVFHAFHAFHAFHGSKHFTEFSIS